MSHWLRLCRRRSPSVFFALLISLAFIASAPARAQEPSETVSTSTIQGAVFDDDGAPVEGARISYTSQSGDTRGSTRSNKDGSYTTEVLAPGPYSVRADARDMLPAETTVTLSPGTPSKANFHLEWINPGPVRLESHYPGDAVDTEPINGRNYLTPGEFFPAVQPVDGALYGPAKNGVQSLSIGSNLGRTTHYDFDEIEEMDETNGAATMNLPAEGVREVTVSRVTPEFFQSLNAAGSVRVSTRSGAEYWHGDLFGILRDQSLGLAGFPDNSDYSRQQLGFGVGGAVIKDKAFLFLGGERFKQDGLLPANIAYPAPNGTALRDASLRENLLLARFDYNLGENTKLFLRLDYDNLNQIGPPNSLSMFRNQVDVPAVAFGLDWNRGNVSRSARVGFQKMVNSINPYLAASVVDPLAPFHIQLGSFSLGPSTAGPRQTLQRDLFGRYDSSTAFRVRHHLRYGGAVHRIWQGDYINPAIFGPSITSSNGLDTIGSIDGNPLLSGGATNPLNYPVGTFTIYNGLGNFSSQSAFNRSTGGHFDTRLEGYAGDSINVIPNLNLSFGLNYIYDTGRTDSDLAPIPCSAIDTTVVSSAPCTGASLILNQYGFFAPFSKGIYQPLGNRVNNPHNNLSPQVGLAWDPGHSGRTVIRASTGIFYDNFLLQNTYQDRINRLSTGQFNRSLTFCPTGSTLFPSGSVVNSVDGLDIASQICGQPIGATVTGTQGPVVVSTAIQDLQQQFQNAQSAVTSGPNVYSLAGSMANFGGLLAPTFRTPRVVHIAAGIERQMGIRSMFSIDYVRELGTQFPLGIDSNHVGDAGFLTDGANPNPGLNTYAAEINAVNATIAANPRTNGICPVANSSGGSSQAAVTCYLANVPTASIVDFARNGLDSSSAFCGPFPCSVLGKPQAAFGGINPAVGSNLMYFPAGRSAYQAIHATYHTSSALNPMRRVEKIDLALSYTLSRYRTNVSAPDGSGGDYSTLTPAEDYNRPHFRHLGSSGLDRTHQIVFTPTIETPHGPRISMLMLLASPIPLSAYIPQADGGGVPGEIFRSDVSGDGTVGDLLTGSFIGTTGKYTSSKIDQAIAYYNKNIAGQLTPAGRALAGIALMSPQQLLALGAYAPLVSSCYPPTPSCGLPGRPAEETWLKTIDLRLTWPFAIGERFKLEPSFSAFNVFNLANFGGPGGQLSGILNGAPGSALNNASSPGVCGSSAGFCTSRLDRVLPGSGTYANGAPRQMEFGLRVTF